MKFLSQKIFLLYIFMVFQFLIGISTGFHLSDLMWWSKHDKDKSNDLKVISLKTIKEKFATQDADEELDNIFFKDIVKQNPVLEDPNCQPGFVRDRRGICREVW